MNTIVDSLNLDGITRLYSDTRSIEGFPAQRRLRLNDEFFEHRIFNIIIATTTYESRLGLTLANLAK